MYFINLLLAYRVSVLAYLLSDYEVKLVSNNGDGSCLRLAGPDVNVDIFAIGISTMARLAAIMVVSLVAILACETKESYYAVTQQDCVVTPTLGWRCARGEKSSPYHGQSNAVFRLHAERISICV